MLLFRFCQWSRMKLTNPKQPENDETRLDLNSWGQHEIYLNGLKQSFFFSQDKGTAIRRYDMTYMGY